MEHLSLKQFLLATTLIAVAIGLIIWSWRTLAGILNPYCLVTLSLGGAMLIGTVVLIPFNRAQLGAIVGGLLFMQMLFLLLIVTVIHEVFFNW